MNTLNWPTAFVIVAIIFAGAFVYNKQTVASKHTSDQMIVALGDKQIWQLKNGQIRWCMIGMGTEEVGQVQINDPVKWNSGTGKYESNKKPLYEDRILQYQNVACSAWSKDNPSVFGDRKPN
ncbi:MAG: hypothetical protein CMM58_02900 [Rhodospirillaceae bacterium]|nr:hypothetical protein [Rhodospirillaceae bacterium]